MRLIETNEMEITRSCSFHSVEGSDFKFSNNLYISIIVTNKCQCRCAYCINGATDQSLELPFEKAVNNIALATKKFGIKEAILLGGEPTLYDKLIPLIDSLKKMGLRKIGLTTNAIELRNKNNHILEDLVKHKIDFINISYHKHGEFITLSELSEIYKRFCEIKSPNQKMRINTNVWKGNNDTVETLSAFLSDISDCADEIRISPIVKNYGSFRVPKEIINAADKMWMTSDEYKRLFTDLLNYYSKNVSIIYNRNTHGFLDYYLIPIPTPIIINYNLSNRLIEQTNIKSSERKIYNLNCLVNGDISLSLNDENIIII